MASGVPKKRGADDEHEERKKLASGEWAGQRRIRLSKEFGNDAHDRIKKEEATGRHAVRFFELQADPYQEYEEQDTFQERLIELARVAWRENAGENLTNFRAVPSRRDDLLNGIQSRVKFDRLLNSSRRGRLLIPLSQLGAWALRQ